MAFTGAIAEQEALLVDLAAAEASMQAAATAAHTERGREIARAILRDADAARTKRDQAEQAARSATADFERLRAQATTALADWPALEKRIQAQLGLAPSPAEAALTAMRTVLDVLASDTILPHQGANRASSLYLGSVLCLTPLDLEVLIAHPYSDEGQLIVSRFDTDVQRLREAWAAAHRSPSGHAEGEQPGPHSNRGYLPSTLIR